MSVRVVDKGARRAKTLAPQRNRKSLRIGVMDEAAQAKHPKAKGATVGEVALWNEFGTMSVPSRSFLRDWADENLDRISRELSADLLRVLFASENEKLALAKRGKQYVQQVVTRIKRGIPPANSAWTLSQKSGTTPLIDTGTLIDSIDYKVSEEQ